MLKEIFSQRLNTQSKTVNNAIITLGDTDDSGKGRKFKSRFLTPGVAGYPGQFGNVLIKKESFDKFINTMVGVPVIINHKDINKDNADDLRVGVVSNVWFDEHDGWYWCDGVIWDETAQNLITEKGWSVSCSYDVKLADDAGGTENNIPYDIEFLDGVFTHLAIVDNPRYERANIVFNSKTVVKNDANFEAKHPRDEQGRFVETESFQNWFSGSKIIDKEGAPLLLYHGSNDDFNTFEKSKYGNGQLGSGFYFTSSKQEAKEYGKNIKEVYLNIKKPFDINQNPEEIAKNLEIPLEKLQTLTMEDETLSKAIKEKGYDGVIAKDFWGEGNDYYVVFEPEQIRYANDKQFVNKDINPNYKEELKQVIEKAKNNPTEHQKLMIGTVSKDLEEKAKENGLDISGYQHDLDVSGTRHAIKEHGQPKTEEPRGQIAITDGDFEKIPEVIYSYDDVSFTGKNKIGRETITYKKSFNDGTIMYVEEIRDKRKTLTINTMYKYKNTGNPRTFVDNNNPLSNASIYIITDIQEDFNHDIKNNVQNNKEQDMALLDELKKLITKVENEKPEGENMDDDKKIENEKVDKRKLIDEVAGIMKSAGADDEKIRTAIAKMEKLAYDKSEAGTADNEKEDDKPADDSKVENEETKKDIITYFKLREAQKHKVGKVDI